MNVFADLLKSLGDQAHDHALKIVSAFVLMALGWVFGRRRARAEWRNRQFYDLINFSLNLVDDGVLQIRTLAEKRCSDVFLNPAACDVIMAAAKRTTVENPIIPLPAGDVWYYLNDVLNDLSEQFSAGHLARDLGLPVREGTYILALTREADGGIRAQKIRALIIQKQLLARFLIAETAEGQPAPIRALKPEHDTRLKTLRLMAAEHALHPDRFREVHLAIPAGPAN